MNKTAEVYFIFALSNKIGIGSYEYEIFSLPESLRWVFDIFRSSGRMFWPVFYVLLLGAIYIVVKGNSPRVAIVLLGIATVIQIADTSVIWLRIREKLMITPAAEWVSPLQNTFWRNVPLKYKKLRWIQPGNYTLHWKNLAAFAAKSGMSTDAVYLARVNGKTWYMARQRASIELASGKYEPDSLYILDPAMLKTAIPQINQKNDLLAKIDDLYVIAPGWKLCSEVKINPVPINIGDRLLFAQSANGVGYMRCGWYQPEQAGTWSNGTTADISLPVKTNVPSVVIIEAIPLVSSLHPTQHVEVAVNSILIGQFNLTGGSHRLRLELSDAIRTDVIKRGVLRLDFKFPNAARPIDLGINSDTRLLALSLVAISLE